MSISRSTRDLLGLTRQLNRTSRHIPRHGLPRGAPSSRAIASFTAPYQANAVSVIQSNVDSTADEFKENERLMAEAMARVEKLTRAAQLGGSAKAREKHIARKKMLPRDRVAALVDPGTTFMELSPLAGHELYPEAEVPSGGIITGVGVVEGVTCMIVANDSTVKGGTYYPITVKKHLRAQTAAQENNLPYVILYIQATYKDS
jgi:3-methylcrotonyl-CoA carboxylase beta subunit